MRFLRQGFCLPPVLRRLWRESREIPAERTAGIGKILVSDARRAEIDGGPSSAGDAGHETRTTRRGGGEATVSGIRDVPMLYLFTRRSRACRKGRRVRPGSALWSRELGSARGERKREFHAAISLELLI